MKCTQKAHLAHGDRFPLVSQRESSHLREIFKRFDADHAPWDLELINKRGDKLEWLNNIFTM